LDEAWVVGPSVKEAPCDGTASKAAIIGRGMSNFFMSL
jgi:hypothetical protein